ncbi:MAG: rhamnulokinase [Promethearchaeota archaeon]
MSNYISIDIGAESGRIILGNLSESGILTLKELYRFKTQGTPIHDRLYWNVIRFYEEILKGFNKNRNALKGKEINGIGIDTWGVDFVILDDKFNLLGVPYHYRDKVMTAAFDSLFEIIPREEIYNKTGIQFMPLNSIVQLHALARDDYPCIKLGKYFLMMPDYFNFLLTGQLACEYTDASTTQLLDAVTKQWHEPFLKSIGVPTRLFLEPKMPGVKLGNVAPSIVQNITVLKNIPVHLVGSHDTASAVVGCPLKTQDSAYLSSGTWSLLGMELDKPILNKYAMERNFTNEGGVDGKIRFLKNIMGLWLLQQTKKSWEKKTGENLDYPQIMKLASKSSRVNSIIFPDDRKFLNPVDMIDEIVAACKETNQDIPKTIGEFAEVIFKSLALQYRKVIEDLQQVTKKKIDNIHVVGGGSKNSLLCQYTADATGKTVFAGPSEATAIGNTIVQAISTGEIKDIKAGREIINDSFSPRKYEPNNTKIWTELYEHKFIPLFLEKK